MDGWMDGCGHVDDNFLLLPLENPGVFMVDMNEYAKYSYIVSL
jgi:hypothetical protein